MSGPAPVANPLPRNKKSIDLAGDQTKGMAMPAYVIFIRERTHDQAELDAYAATVGPLLQGVP